MKKLGIAAAFALFISAGAFALPVEAFDSQLTLNPVSAPLPAFGQELASDSVQLLSYGNDDLQEDLIDFIIQILGIIWGYNNLGVTFDSYPYATGPQYMKSDMNQASLDFTFPAHFYRFAVDSSVFYDPGLWFGNSTRFEGLIWKFFGPVIEVNSYFGTQGGSGYLDEVGYKGNLRIGGDIALIQTNPFSAFYYMQWNHYINIPVRNSLDIGFIVRSYPFKPLMVEWRVNWQFPEEFTNCFFESHLEAGAMVAGPLEAFVAWNYKSYPGFGYRGHGGEAGVRYHF